MMKQIVAKDAAQLAAYLRANDELTAHVIVQTRDLEELTKMGQLLASRQGLLSLRLRGSRFINVHRRELTSCYRCSGLKLYTLDLSLTDLLDSTAESLFDQLSVYSVR